MDEASTTLADLADQNLRRDIVSGALKPSEKLAVAALIKRYGIGASPLREALSRLTMDRLVILEGKRGFTVAPVSVTELDDVSMCRRLVEVEAVRLSVKGGDELWESRVVSAFYRLERAEERVQQGIVNDFEEWEQRNRQFHEAIVSACGSSWMLRLQTLLYAQHERYRRLSLLHRDPSRDVHAEHRTIMQACLDRDIDAAVMRSEEHIDKTVAAVRAVLEPGNKPHAKRSRAATRRVAA